MRTVFSLAIAVLVMACRVRAADNQLTDMEQAEGWLLLFDGSSVKGWTTSNLRPEANPVENGTLAPYKKGAYYLMTDRLFSDFELQLDFKTSEGCNSGVFLRADPTRGMELGDDTAWYAFEVAIDETQSEGYHATGAIYDLAATERNLSKPIGEWNHLHVVCDGDLISVKLNGTPVSELDLSQWSQPNKRPDGSATKFDYSMRDRSRSGFIGLQDHGHPVWFKNIKVRPLHEECFEHLFDGKSLGGWQAYTEEGQEVVLEDSDFSVTDDAAIRCAGEEHSYWLCAPGGPYKDFTLRLEYRVAKGSNSGVFVRAAPSKHPAYSGLECQLIDDSTVAISDTHTSGAVYDVLTPMRKAARAAGEWNELEISMRGRKYVCRLNGFKVIDADFNEFKRPYGKWETAYSNLPLEGLIGMQNHGGEAWFRNIRIRRDAQ